jgi:hypothetical protein
VSWIYVDEVTGTWGEAADLLFVEEGRLPEDEIEKLLGDSDGERIELAQRRSTGFAVPWRREG